MDIQDPGGVPVDYARHGHRAPVGGVAHKNRLYRGGRFVPAPEQTPDAAPLSYAPGDQDPSGAALYGPAEDRAGFEAAIASDPLEATNHAVFGDWLEEQGQPEEAAWRRALGQWAQWGIPPVEDAPLPPEYAFWDLGQDQGQHDGRWEQFRDGSVSIPEADELLSQASFVLPLPSYRHADRVRARGGYPTGSEFSTDMRRLGVFLRGPKGRQRPFVMEQGRITRPQDHETAGANLGRIYKTKFVGLQKLAARLAAQAGIHEWRRLRAEGGS